MSDKSSWADRYYTHYIGRDLAHLLSGGLFIFLVKSFLWDFPLQKTPTVLELIVLSALSYLLGIFFDALSLPIRLIFLSIYYKIFNPSKPESEEQQWSEPHFVYNQLRNFPT